MLVGSRGNAHSRRPQTAKFPRQNYAFSKYRSKTKFRIVNRFFFTVKVNPEFLVAVWRKVSMRNLERSKRVSEANNSCGLYEIFYLREYAWDSTLKTSHWDVFKRNLLQCCNKEERSCSLLLEMLSHFSPPSLCAKSMAQSVSLSAESDQGFQPWTRQAGASLTACLPFGELCAISR